MLPLALLRRVYVRTYGRQYPGVHREREQRLHVRVERNAGVPKDNKGGGTRRARGRRAVAVTWTEAADADDLWECRRVSQVYLLIFSWMDIMILWFRPIAYSQNSCVRALLSHWYLTGVRCTLAQGKNGSRISSQQSDALQKQ
jgi:hypothetical protein